MHLPSASPSQNVQAEGPRRPVDDAPGLWRPLHRRRLCAARRAAPPRALVRPRHSCALGSHATRRGQRWRLRRRVPRAPQRLRDRLRRSCAAAGCGSAARGSGGRGRGARVGSGGRCSGRLGGCGCPQQCRAGRGGGGRATECPRGRVDVMTRESLCAQAAWHMAWQPRLGRQCDALISLPSRLLPSCQ